MEECGELGLELVRCNGLQREIRGKCLRITTKDFGAILILGNTYGASLLTFWCRNYFFLILAHPVYKM